MSLIDGTLYMYGANPEFTATTLIALGDDGTLESRVELPGWSASVIRAR